MYGQGGDGTGRPGSKHHIACDSSGIPIAIITTAGNVPGIKAAPDLVEAIPPVAGRTGRPRRRPDTILADGGYDSAAFRDWPRSKRIEPIIPQRSRKKIIVRWERRLDLHEGFAKLAASLICWRRLAHNVIRTC